VDGVASGSLLFVEPFGWQPFGDFVGGHADDPPC
jgi:hypothetical protein